MKPIDRHPSRSIRTFQRERSPGAWERNKNPSTNENATNENAVILDSKKQIFVSSSSLWQILPKNYIERLNLHWWDCRQYKNNYHLNPYE